MDDIEKRFCTCGYYVIGSPAYRASTFAFHRKSGQHKKRVYHNALALAVEQAFAAHEAAVEAANSDG